MQQPRTWSNQPADGIRRSRIPGLFAMKIAKGGADSERNCIECPSAPWQGFVQRRLGGYRREEAVTDPSKNKPLLKKNILLAVAVMGRGDGRVHPFAQSAGVAFAFFSCELS